MRQLPRQPRQRPQEPDHPHLTRPPPALPAHAAAQARHTQPRCCGPKQPRWPAAALRHGKWCGAAGRMAVRGAPLFFGVYKCYPRGWRSRDSPPCAGRARAPAAASRPWRTAPRCRGGGGGHKGGPDGAGAGGRGAGRGRALKAGGVGEVEGVGREDGRGEGGVAGRAER